MPPRRIAKRSKPRPIIWTADIIHERPQIVGTVIRRLHATTDRQRSSCLQDLKKIFGPDQDHPKIWTKLFEGGLPEAVADIAADRSLYSNFQEDPLYAALVYGLLTQIISVSVEGTGPAIAPSLIEARKKWANHVLEQFPRVWSVLARHDGCITNDQGSGRKRSEGFRGYISELLCAYVTLHMEERGHYPHITASDAPQVALLAWLFAEHPACRLRLIVALSSCITSEVQTDVDALVDKVLVRNKYPGIVKMFFARCSNVLITEDLLNGELARHLEFMAQVMQHPVMKQRRGQDEDLGTAFLCAAQRQVCSGDESRVWGILRYTFSHIVDMFKHDEATGRVARTSLMFSNYVILLVARSVVPAALEDDATCLDDFEAIIFIYSYVFEKLGETDRPIDSDYRKSVHRVWHRAFDDLQALSPAAAPMRSTIIEWWIHFGTKSGVDVEAPYDPTAELTESGDGADDWSKDMGCGWRECLCFGERTYHSLRMCKRCKKVMYCSTKCQRRDWMDGGHKYVCRPAAPVEGEDDGDAAKALQQLSLHQPPAGDPKLTNER